MTHIRSQIRAWCAANLTGSSDAGARVYNRRSLPLAKDGTPALIYSVQGEQAAVIAFDEAQQRTVSLRVTGVVKDDSANGEDTLDRLAVFVEQAIAADPSLGGIAKEYEYRSADFAFLGDGEKTLCTMALLFDFTVYTERADPQTAI